MKVQPNYTRNYTEINNNNQKPRQSFGGIMVPLASFSKFIETTGFLGEFLTLDAIGMSGPCVVQSYMRNREELGHLNYKAGREDLIRVLLSGPAFFFVPLGIISLAAKFKGSCAKVGSDVINSFKPIMEKAVSNPADTSQLKDKFIRSFVTDAFSEFKGDKNEIKKLIDEAVGKKKPILPFGPKAREYKETIEKLGEMLTNLNKANGKFLDDTRKVRLGGEKGNAFNMDSLIDDIRNYLKDFTKKTKNKSINAEFISDFHKNAKILRNVSTVAAIASLCAFLTYVPKLYQTDKNKFPGTDGLNTDKKAEGRIK